MLVSEFVNIVNFEVVFNYVKHCLLLFCPKPAIKYEFTPFKTPKQIVDWLVIQMSIKALVASLSIPLISILQTSI